MRGVAVGSFFTFAFSLHIAAPSCTFPHISAHRATGFDARWVRFAKSKNRGHLGACGGIWVHFGPHRNPISHRPSRLWGLWVHPGALGCIPVHRRDDS
jgi:hypothetical protein